MDRFWLLTCTCYGAWLPGDKRGFVGRVRERRLEDRNLRRRVVHNRPETPHDNDIPGLEQASERFLKGQPIKLTQSQADVLLRQFLETARHRGWELYAVAIMWNHFHVVVGVEGDPEPARILSTFKSWGTRALSSAFGEPGAGTWWTERGSKRKLPNEDAVLAAVHYVANEQPNPLVTWVHPKLSGAEDTRDDRLNERPPDTSR